MRQRIFTASQAGDLKKVRNLQKLMLRSRSNTLLSVRRVTEINAGRATAGVDGKVVLPSQSKAALANWVQHRSRPWIPKPVKGVFIPKPGTMKKRGLGIPVIVDRCLQAVALGALEPEWEARFEPKSYGFRPGRGCHDAIGAIYSTLNGKNPQRAWVLDADLTAAFDRIDHARLMASLGTFPARGLVRQWLKAGVVDRGRFAPTEEETWQSGVISPLLFNVALHGMEKAAGVRYYTTGRDAGSAQSGSPVLVRYADDLVAMCTSREQAEEVKERLTAWLAPRGPGGPARGQRRNRWVFGDRDSGAYLLKLSWTKIIRHQLVKGKTSPDDPALESYWAQRRRKGTPLPVDAMTVCLLQAQYGRCPTCGGLPLHADHPPQSPQEWETWRAVIRKAISKQYIAFPDASAPDGQRLRLLHTHCQRRDGAAAMTSPALLPAGEPLGLA
ncbi:reverse transcriptase domain-containing protein [Streptomyces sp. LZ34]